MARRRNFRIDGMKQLEKNLGDLGKRVGGRQALAIAEKAAEPVHTKVQAEAPVRRGVLRSAVQKGPFKPRADMPVAAFVLVDPKAAPHGHLVEFGTSHSEADPFFKRGVSRSRRKALRIIVDEMKRLVEKPYRT